MQYVRIQTPLHANTSATIHRGEVMSQYRPEEDSPQQEPPAPLICRRDLTFSAY